MQTSNHGVVTAKIESPRICYLGLSEYESTHKQMRVFTDSRDDGTRDEIWLVEHSPVFTYGHNADDRNVLDAKDIPVIKSDRGGDVTYHGPGQAVVYCMFNLKRLNLSIKTLVWTLEEAVIQLLAVWGVVAERRENAPGVYVGGQKVASLGLRVRKGCSFHGIAINVDMDLGPFNQINPCGLRDVRVNDLRGLGIKTTVNEVMDHYCESLITRLYEDV